MRTLVDHAAFRWTDYEQDRRAWERANVRETRASRFWWAFAVLALVASFTVIYGCDEGDTIYNTGCKPEKPRPWNWSEASLCVVAAPAVARNSMPSLSGEQVDLFDAALNLSDAEAAEFAARMGEEFRLLWEWFLTLTPEQRSDVVHFIRMQSALAGNGDYAWEDANGWHYACADGVSSFTGLR